MIPPPPSLPGSSSSSSSSFSPPLPSQSPVTCKCDRICTAYGIFQLFVSMILAALLIDNYGNNNSREMLRRVGCQVAPPSGAFPFQSDRGFRCWIWIKSLSLLLWFQTGYPASIPVSRHFFPSLLLFFNAEMMFVRIDSSSLADYLLINRIHRWNSGLKHEFTLSWKML